MTPDLKKLDPLKRGFSLFEEFKKFAFKGNMIDLAVALVVGAAFTKVVESLVKNIVMPLVTMFIPSDGGYTQWSIPLWHGAMPIGVFLADLVNFLIVTFAVFLFMVKILGWLIKKKEEAAAVAGPSNQELLLAEIRDLLKKNESAP